MKKNFRRAMAAVMAAALTLSLAGTAAEADAAKKKKIKLASKSVTVNVKKTKTVKIKNVKAKQVKKLTVKSASKKIATAKAKGKTAVKVTGKKAGKSTKVKITLKIKGQKKATKLTLKVKVAKAKPPVPATNAPAPATQAPNVPSTKAPDGPAVSQPPQGGDASQAPATQKPSDKPKESKTPKPEWTPDPDKQNKVEDFTLTYGENGEGYKFEAASMVKFEDAANYAAVAPKDGIDVRYYDQVIVNYKSDEEITSGDEGWGGKATLSSTDEGLGCTAYTDGLYLRYLNDLKYAEGGYTVEYNIKKTGEHGALNDGYDFEDVGLVDCISVQLESNTHPYVDSEDGSQKGVNFRLMSIEFKAPAKAPEASAPAASAPAASAPAASAPAASAPAASAPAASAPAASAKPVTDQDVEMTFKKGESVVTEIGVGETASVEVALKNGVNAEIEGIPTITVTDPTVAEIQNGTIKGLKKGTAVVNASVKIKGQQDAVTVTENLIISGANDLKVEAAIQAPVKVALGETAALEVKLTKVVDVETTDVQITGVTWTVVEGEADVETDGAETAVLTAKAPGTVKVRATVDVRSKSNAKDPGKAVTEVVEVQVYVPQLTFTAADLGGEENLSYTFEKVWKGSNKLISYNFTDDEKTKIKDGTYKKLVLSVEITGATANSNCFLQPHIDSNNGKVKPYYGNGISTSENKEITQTLDLTGDFGEVDINNLKSLYVSVEWDNPSDDKTIVFDGEIEFKGIKFLDESSNETSASIPEAGKKSDKNTIAGITGYLTLFQAELPDGIDLRNYAQIKYEAEITGSDKALNAILLGEGLSEHKDHTTGITNGEAMLDLSKYAKTITNGKYKVGLQVPANGFNGNAKLKKITLIPKN